MTQPWCVFVDAYIYNRAQNCRCVEAQGTAHDDGDEHARHTALYMCAFYCTGKDTYTLDESCADVCRAVLALALAAIANAGGVCGAEACRSVAAA